MLPKVNPRDNRNSPEETPRWLAFPPPGAAPTPNSGRGMRGQGGDVAPGSANGAKGDTPASLTGARVLGEVLVGEMGRPEKVLVARKERAESNALGIPGGSARPEGASVSPETKSA